MVDPIQLRDAPVGNRPRIHYWEHANQATREALVATPSDVGRVSKQMDDGSYHVLLDDSPLTWLSWVSLATVTSLLAAKAPLASPTFTGTPAAPTATPGTNTTQLATTAFVRAEVAALVDSSPGALDTLDELAAALGDDPNFATTVTTALSNKQPLDADLTAIAALSGTSGLLRKTAADTWALDTNTYLTGNQALTISGDASGAGATSLSLTLATVNSSPGGVGSSSKTLTATVNGKGLVTALAEVSIAIAESQVTNLVGDLSTLTSAIAAKADLASPTFTGTPAAPTATPSTNTTQLATTAFVTAAVAAGGGASTSAANTWSGVQTFNSTKLKASDVVDTNADKILTLTPKGGTVIYWVDVRNGSGSGTNAPRLLATNAAGTGNVDLQISAQASGSVFFLTPFGDNATYLIKGSTTTESGGEMRLRAPADNYTTGLRVGWLRPEDGNPGVLIGSTTAVGSITGTNLLTLKNGTAPTSLTDTCIAYANDSAAGDSNLLARNEVGEVSRLTGLAARVSTQFDKTSDNALANITGLTRNVEAGKVYRFRAVLFTTSNVAGGVQAAIAGTCTATAIVYEARVFDAALAAQTRTTTKGNAVGAVTAVTAALVIIEGTITVNAAGTLTVQFAQNASNGTASSVLVGSSFEIQQI